MSTSTFRRPFSQASTNIARTYETMVSPLCNFPSPLDSMKYHRGGTMLPSPVSNCDHKVSEPGEGVEDTGQVFDTALIFDDCPALFSPQSANFHEQEPETHATPSCSCNGTAKNTSARKRRQKSATGASEKPPRIELKHSAQKVFERLSNKVITASRRATKKRNVCRKLSVVRAEETEAASAASAYAQGLFRDYGFARSRFRTARLNSHINAGTLDAYATHKWEITPAMMEETRRLKKVQLDAEEDACAALQVATEADTIAADLLEKAGLTATMEIRALDTYHKAQEIVRELKIRAKAAEERFKKLTGLICFGRRLMKSAVEAKSCGGLEAIFSAEVVLQGIDDEQAARGTKRPRRQGVSSA